MKNIANKYYLKGKEINRQKRNLNWRNLYRRQKGYEPVKEINCCICSNKFIRQSIDQKYCKNSECRLAYLRRKALEKYYKDKNNIMKRRKNNIDYRIKSRLRDRLRDALKSQSIKKQYHTIDLLGCSIIELKALIENKFKDGMTWSNYGKNGWHIDHIKPCCSFNLLKKEEQEKCFHYTNLQPLWQRENLQKSGKVL